MLRQAVLLCVLAAAVAQQDFFEEYGRQKIFTTCFGEKLTYSQLALIENAKSQCLHQRPYIPGLQPATNTYNIIAPGLVPSQVGYGYPAPPVYPTGLLPTLGYQRPVTHVHGKSRKARQANNELFANRDYIVGLIDTVYTALSNYTCVARTLNGIDDDLNIRLDNIQRDYYQFPIEPTLRQDLLEGIELCYQLSGCLPVDKTRSPLPPKLQRLIFFTQCEKKARVANCFKHDLRRNLFRFDLSALPDGGRVGKLEKLVALLVGSNSLDELELF